MDQGESKPPFVTNITIGCRMTCRYDEDTLEYSQVW